MKVNSSLLLCLSILGMLVSCKKESGASSEGPVKSIREKLVGSWSFDTRRAGMDPELILTLELRENGDFELTAVSVWDKDATEIEGFGSIGSWRVSRAANSSSGCVLILRESNGKDILSHFVFVTGDSMQLTSKDEYGSIFDAAPFDRKRVSGPKMKHRVRRL